MAELKLGWKKRRKEKRSEAASLSARSDSERLTVPHPLMGEREFALVPLCEIMRQRRHPVTGRTVGEMLEELRNK